VKRKKLAEASFHSLLGATAGNPCYLHGAPDIRRLTTHAICVVPPAPETAAKLFSAVSDRAVW